MSNFSLLFRSKFNCYSFLRRDRVDEKAHRIMSTRWGERATHCVRLVYRHNRIHCEVNGYVVEPPMMTVRHCR
jgi:hypothetical protein